MDLADARLRQTEDGSDFGETQIFEIIHGEDLLRYIGQFRHPLSEKLHELGLFEVIATGDVVFVGQKIVERGAFALLALGALVDGDERDGFCLLDPLGVFLGVESESGGDLG